MWYNLLATGWIRQLICQLAMSSLHESCALLTINEVLGAVPPNTFSKQDARTWKKLLQAISNSSEDIQNQIIHVASVKTLATSLKKSERNKRQAETQLFERRVQRHLEGKW